MPTLADLFRMGRQYVADALPGGSLNPEVTRQGALDAAAISATPVPVLGDLIGLGADVHRYVNEPESRTPGNFALTGLGLLPFVPAMTAWHGSPHKFDKFDLSKIGTGEGAQAYGHGVYLAESPEVGKEYARVLTKNAFFDGKPIYEIDPNTLGRRETILSGVQNMGNDARGALPGRYTPQGLDSEYEGPIAAMKALIKSGKVPKNATKWIDENGTIKVSSVEPQLYKTDIPDEAVARFLDWDKPLSQQAPEVQAALANTKNKQLRAMVEYANVPYSEAIGGEAKTMGEAFRLLNLNLQGKSSADSAKASALLAKQGILGIRYLDGGSRSAGQGSSNFVAFDPKMIRILERNGQATGLQPWKPGEYRLRDLITN